MAGGVSSGFSDDDDGVMSDINVTPLVDVTLVLLIVFMVTVPAIVGSAPIKINLPNSTAVELATELPPMIVSLRRDDDGKQVIFLNDRQTDEAGLRALIEEIGLPPEEQPVTLAADKNIPHGDVIHLMDVLHAIGLKKIAMNTQHVGG
jgi:biopolymer transport protein ExbD